MIVSRKGKAVHLACPQGKTRIANTPSTTYHLEFRYGSDIDALTRYAEGPCAYWLAAGFPVDADEAMIKDFITLFCEENLTEMAAEEPAA